MHYNAKAEDIATDVGGANFATSSTLHFIILS